MTEQQLTLSELNTYIRETIESEFTVPIWLIAEISELNINRSGHCYLDLIERDELSKKIIARQRATIWAFQFRLIKAHFESVTGQELTGGLKVLINIKVNYHVLYGISVNVLDIEPSFTLGEQAKHRELIIQQLSSDGVIDMNKGLELCEVPQRIALISSETAAGYGDFMEQLKNNENQFRFSVRLFASVMQGEKTSSSIISALEDIYHHEEQFDAIVIIRGGGAKAELAAFDDYDLAFMISQSPLPVLTGIGHERDQSVADLVAWKNFKTPTAVAAFLIDHLLLFKHKIDGYSELLNSIALTRLSEENLQIEKLEQLILSESKNAVTYHKSRLKDLTVKAAKAATGFLHKHQTKMENALSASRANSRWFLEKNNLFFETKKIQLNYRIKVYINQKNASLDLLSEKNNALDPLKQLHKGFAIVTKNNKRITTAHQLKEGNTIKIYFSKGSAGAKIQEINTD
jgi:exodeoxyribonuclease VII large subunit